MNFRPHKMWIDASFNYNTKNDLGISEANV